MMNKCILCLALSVLFSCFSLMEAGAQELDEKEIKPQQVESFSAAKANVATQDFGRKMKKSDFEKIRNAQRHSPMAFLTSYNNTSKLERPSWKMLNNQYHCLYTAKDGRESEYIQAFIKRNQGFINQKRLTIKDLKGKQGHPQFEFYLPNGNLYMTIKARMEEAK